MVTKHVPVQTNMTVKTDDETTCPLRTRGLFLKKPSNNLASYFLVLHNPSMLKQNAWKGKKNIMFNFKQCV